MAFASFSCPNLRFISEVVAFYRSLERQDKLMRTLHLDTWLTGPSSKAHRLRKVRLVRGGENRAQSVRLRDAIIGLLSFFLYHMSHHNNNGAQEPGMPHEQQGCPLPLPPILPLPDHSPHSSRPAMSHSMSRDQTKTEILLC